MVSRLVSVLAFASHWMKRTECVLRCRGDEPGVDTCDGDTEGDSGTTSQNPRDPESTPSKRVDPPKSRPL